MASPRCDRLRNLPARERLRRGDGSALSALFDCSPVRLSDWPRTVGEASHDFRIGEGFAGISFSRMRMARPSGCSISKALDLRTRSLSLRKPKLRGSKSEDRFANCLPTAPSVLSGCCNQTCLAYHPSQRSIGLISLGTIKLKPMLLNEALHRTA